MSVSQRSDEDQLGLEIQEVLDWRLRVLLDAGYPEKYAWMVASELSVDLHRAANLVAERGCPPKTAMAILL